MNTNNIKLVLGCGAFVVLGAMALQGCSSGDDSSGGAGTGGTSTGGTSTGGTSSGGKGGTSAGGTSSGGKGGTGTAGTGTAGTGTAGTGTAGTGTGGTGVGGTGVGAAGDTGAAGSPGNLVDCTTFCSDEEATCKFGAADVAPYANQAACMTACMGFTPGAVGVYPDGPTSGDTYACRRWHLSKAATAGNATAHCPHTGKVSIAAYGVTTAGPCN